MDKDFFEEIFNFSVQRIRKAAKKSPGNQQKQKKESGVKRTIDWLYERGGGRNVPVRRRSEPRITTTYWTESQIIRICMEIYLTYQ